jgi:trehalose/maltose hydrolase-like predicted phosphorylase
MGFAGIRICDDGIFVGPNLPGNFEQLSFSLLWRGLQLHFNIEKRKKIELKVKGKGKLNIGIYGKKLRERESGRTYKSNWKNGVWSEFK